MVLQVTQIMVPLLKFYFNEDVRASAAQVFIFCCVCVCGTARCMRGVYQQRK